MLKKLLIPALLAPQAVFAHAGDHGGGDAFLSGLIHPLGGSDHLLAMVAVGIWAAVAGGAQRWQLPLAFLGAMGAGAALGLAGLSLPLVEPLILASSILIGLILTLALRPGPGIALALTALFGLMHGFAHGAEAPEAGLLAYGAGFLLATAGLHGAGLLLGRLAISRWLGAATAAAGLVLTLS